jgi:molybdate/tungstate transport system substrate-binding protein
LIPRCTRRIALCSTLSALAAVLFGASIAAKPLAAPAELYVCHAGSVQAAFTVVEQQFTREHPDTAVKDVSGGSVALAGRMASGLQPCDVFAAADYLDIELLLKPAALADYTIVFAHGRMVLAYRESDRLTHGVASPGVFKPPSSVPAAASDWYRKLTQPGVRISGSHPFLDPSGYRSHMMFELTERFYHVPDLANLLLEHYTILPAVGGAESAARPALGDAYNFQFIYEHSAAAAAKQDAAYRYVTLPDQIDLSTTANDKTYAEAAVTMRGVGASSGKRVSIPGARVAWGLAIPKTARNVERAVAFVKLLLEPAGTAALEASGPSPVTPALVGASDVDRLPAVLRPLVHAGTIRR